MGELSSCIWTDCRLEFLFYMIINWQMIAQTTPTYLEISVQRREGP